MSFWIECALVWVAVAGMTLGFFAGADERADECEGDNE